MARNRELFNKVADLIEAHPNLYNQYTWGSTELGGLPKAQVLVEHPELQHGAIIVRADDAINGSCGTYCCIAGWATLLSGGRINVLPSEWSDTMVENWQDENGADIFPDWYGARALGIEDEEDTSQLFHESWRPKKGMSVPEALRALGDGADLRDVSDDDWDDGWLY